jgi:hypothetical protein
MSPSVGVDVCVVLVLRFLRLEYSPSSVTVVLVVEKRNILKKTHLGLDSSPIHHHPPSSPPSIVTVLLPPSLMLSRWPVEVDVDGCKLESACCLFVLHVQCM